MTVGPLGVERKQISIQRAEPDPEDIGSVTSDYLTDKSATVARSMDNPLDRNTILAKRHNGGVGLLAPEVAFVLEPLRAGQQLPIDRCCSDLDPDRPHGFPHSAKERCAGVLEQMPAIGDLNGVRQCFGNRLAVAAVTIARYDLVLRMGAEPSLNRGAFPIWQERHDPAALQIANDRPLAVEPQ